MSEFNGFAELGQTALDAEINALENIPPNENLLTLQVPELDRVLSASENSAPPTLSPRSKNELNNLIQNYLNSRSAVSTQFTTPGPVLTELQTPVRPLASSSLQNMSAPQVQRTSSDPLSATMLSSTTHFQANLQGVLGSSGETSTPLCVAKKRCFSTDNSAEIDEDLNFSMLPTELPKPKKARKTEREINLPNVSLTACKSAEDRLCFGLQEILCQWKKAKKLSRAEKVDLFRGAVAYLIAIKEVSCKAIIQLTLHSVLQVIAISWREKEKASFLLGLDSEDTIELPIWFVEVLEVYFSAIRATFIKGGVALQKKRIGSFFVETEQFFINTCGTASFRPSVIHSQFMKNMKLYAAKPADDLLQRKVNMMLPLDHSPYADFQSDTTYTRGVYDSTGAAGNGHSWEEVFQVVRKRVDQLRYIRAIARAELYISQVPASQKYEAVAIKEFAEKHWGEKRGDIQRLVKAVNQLRKDSANTASSKRRSFNPHLSSSSQNEKDFQERLFITIEQQSWPGLCDVDMGPQIGRAVIATSTFSQGDVVVDYHGDVIFNTSLNQYLHENPVRRPEYILEVRNSPRRLIDASFENCPNHPNRRCYGRLLNHKEEKTYGKINKDCNLKLMDISLSKIVNFASKRVIVLVAKRKIEIGEELRFDYGDDVAREMFKLS